MYKYTQNFPKKDRYSLGTKLEKIILELITESFYASNLPALRKLPHIERALVLTELLKILIRLSYDMKTLDYKKYEYCQTLLQEIGKMLGGWKRSLL